jgi:hypothetical protein
MHPSKLKPGEFVAIAGGVLLGVALFLKWYASKGEGKLIKGSEMIQGSISGWDIHTIIRYPILIAALAPIILTYIILRNHALSWPRGEMTAVLGIFAFGLIAYNGLANRPATSNSLSSLELGWYLAIIGSILIIGGSASRASSVERKRKPPGTL